MIITFGGNAGSGKSLVTKTLAKELAYARISVGDIWRAKAQTLGMSIHEMDAHVKAHPELDKEMDAEVAPLARAKAPCLVEGRVQWHFLPESKKIYLYCKPEIAAQRIFSEQRESEKENTTYASTLTNIIKRNTHTAQRYKDVYGIDITDLNNYDFVLDTSHLTPEAVIQKVKEFIQQ